MIADAATVFAVQLVYVLLLGLQSLNVNGGHKTAAALTSFVLGTCGYQITAAIAANRGNAFGLVWFAYVLAGPCGIVSSMVIFSRWRGRK